MGICSSGKHGKGEIEEVRINKAELKDIKKSIEEVDQFLKRSKSSYSFTDYPTQVEQLINKTIGTMKNIHEYAMELFESIITLRKKTDELLKNMQTEITKLVEELERLRKKEQKMEQRQKVGQEHKTEISNTSSRLGGFVSTFTGSGQDRQNEEKERQDRQNEEKERQDRQNEEKERDLLVAAKLENILKAANASLQNQNVQAIINKTTEVLRGIQDKSEIRETDKAELQDIVEEWKRNTKQLEDEKQKKEEREKEEQRKREEEEQRIREEEKQREREEEEQRIREEEEQRKKEEEELRKREEKEQRKRKEEEQRKREEEEQRIREEEEQRKREEDEHRKREEEKRRKREQEERESEEQREREKEEQQQREEEEQREREEEEQRIREEEEQRKREEEEQRIREEEEQREREEEEQRIQKEEEQRKREEEEQRIQKEEEQRKREEEEQRKREEEELRKKEEKEQRKREEEEQRKREEEKQRIREEEEQRKREEEKCRKREEKRQKRRRNPKHWKPFVYDIADKQLVNDEHNDGICCVAFAIPDSIHKDDLCCSCSDHSTYNIRECISDDEQIASLITNIKSSTYEKLSLECPLRVYIPYNNITGGKRTIAVKMSVDEGKWNRVETLKPYTLKDKWNLKFVGFEINNFTYLKILAVTIIKPEKVIVPEEGILYTCIGDKDVSIMFPESTFKDPTQISLTANNIPKVDILSAKANHGILSDVSESTSVIAFDCGTATDKPFELIVKGLRHKGNYDKFNALYYKKDGKWKFADCKIIGNVAHITIPEDVSKILLVGLTLPKRTPIEQVFESANEMVKHSNEIKVHVVCKQKSYNWNDAHIASVSSENKTNYVDELLTQGYAEGPAPSREFCIAEGGNIHLGFAGNIDIDGESHPSKRLTLQSLRNFPDCITCHLSVVNEHIQKREQYFRGYVKYQLENESSNSSQQQIAQLPIYLEKKIRHFQVAATYKVKFVMDTKVTALVQYIAWKLNENGDTQDWDHFLHCLEDKNMIRRLNIKMGKGSEHEIKRKKCEEFMRFWIKEKPKSINKVNLIMDALEKSGFDDLKSSASRFIKFFDGNGILSDSSLIKMAEKIGAEWELLGICLGLTTPEIEQVKMDNASTKLQIYHMLNQWRMSDKAIELDHNIVSELVEAMTVSNCDSELIDFIRLNADPGNSGKIKATNQH